MDITEDGDYLRIANKLYAASKPLLAIKAYERALSEVEKDAVADSMPLSDYKVGAGDALFKDFILHCNAFGVKSATSDIKMARDFLCLCLQELKRRNCIQGDLDANDPNQLSIPSQEDKGIAFLVSLTLSNWACLLLRSGNTRKAAAFLQLALTYSAAEELTRVVLLNLCAVDVHNCSFLEARERAMEVLLEDEKDDEEGQENMFEDEVAHEDVNGLLCAFAYHNMAIAEEYLQPQEAEGHYNQGKEMLLSSPYQQWSSIIECARKRFLDIIQRRREEAARRRELAEAEMEAARQVEATVRRKGRGARSATARQPSLKPGNRGKKHKKRASGLTNDTRDESVELPSITDYLRQKMQTQGLSNVAVPLLRVVEVGNVVFGGNPSFESFSPFKEGANLNNVAMILVCEETPLQVVDEAELNDAPPPRRTIWTPFISRQDHILITPPQKPKPGNVLSRDVANVVKSFMPPPLSEKSIENAQRSVTAFKKILNHRLLMLLRAENAFEEKWKATKIVRSALVAFNLAQDMLKLKDTIKLKRETRAILENVSARRIVRFLRLIIERKSSTSIPLLREARVKYFEEKAAITLQKYARRWLAIKELRSLQAQRRAEILRVMKIQSIYRMHVTQRRYLVHKEERNKALEFEKEMVAREYAATRIQRAYRRHAHLLSRWYEGDKKQFILHHFKSSRDYYATLIQSTFRGFLVRRVYGPAVYARRCYGRNCYRALLVNKCATIIQSAFRGYRVRRTTRIPLQQHLRQCLLQRAREKVESQRRIQNEAARVIQCAYRCYVARRIAFELRKIREKERLLRRGRAYPPFRLEEQVY